MPAPVPGPQLLQAPVAWQSVELISDLHLHSGDGATLAALDLYLRGCSADAVFILGDLFEVWLGDDCLDDTAAFPFEHRVQQVLRAAAVRRSLFFLPGNRDFLLGSRACQACGLTPLHDPTVLEWADRRWLLTHGDALCLDDTEYLEFRALVRGEPWQQRFLSQPLALRQQQATAIRQQSQAHKQAMGYADLTPEEVVRWLDAMQCDTMIHGHTHMPGDHAVVGSRQRHVLSDWDLNARPGRAQVLRLQARPGSPALVGRHDLGHAA